MAFVLRHSFPTPTPVRCFSLLSIFFPASAQNPAELDEGDKKKGGEDEDQDEKPLPENYDPCYFPPGASCVRSDCLTSAYQLS